MRRRRYAERTSPHRRRPEGALHWRGRPARRQAIRRRTPHWRRPEGALHWRGRSARRQAIRRSLRPHLRLTLSPLLPRSPPSLPSPDENSLEVTIHHPSAGPGALARGAARHLTTRPRAAPTHRLTVVSTFSTTSLRPIRACTMAVPSQAAQASLGSHCPKTNRAVACPPGQGRRTPHWRRPEGVLHRRDRSARRQAIKICTPRCRHPVVSAKLAL